MTGSRWLLLSVLLPFSQCLCFSQQEMDDYSSRSEIQADIWAADSLISSGNTEVLNYRMNDFQVAHLNGHELMLLRNALFARYGYRFENGIVQSHFQQFSWYDPRHSDVGSMLNAIDEWNLRLILHYEEHLENAPAEMPDRNDMTGFWHGSPAVGSGYSDRIFIFPEGDFVYRKNSMDGAARLHELSGTWYLDEGHLVLQADSAVYLAGGEIREPHTSYASEYIIEGGERSAVAIVPVEVFRLPVDDFASDYSAVADEEGYEHLTVPYARIGISWYWRMSSDPSAEHLH